MDKFEAVANLAFFLLERTGSVCGKWEGKLSAKEQRTLFGHFIGKGLLLIDGSTETVKHVVKVCFGLDYDVTYSAKFSQVARKTMENKATYNTEQSALFA
jgi:hypothetical protein